jgi:hypothetical protein
MTNRGNTKSRYHAVTTIHAKYRTTGYSTSTRIFVATFLLRKPSDDLQSRRAEPM